jgi:hypothetical protein
VCFVRTWQAQQQRQYLPLLAMTCSVPTFTPSTLLLIIGASFSAARATGALNFQGSWVTVGFQH